MFRFLFSLIVILGVAGVLLYGPLFYFSPAPSTRVIAAVEQATDLDRYLQESEAKFGDIKPGLEKGIVWANATTKAKQPLCLIYLHGFSAARAEMVPVFNQVAKDRGANLFYTRLKAHGLRDGEAFAEVTPQDWIDDAREARAICRKIGEKTILVGMSTGAMLAIHLAEESPVESDLLALVLISPNYFPADAKAKLVSGPIGKYVARAALGKYRSFKTQNEAHAQNWTPTYRSEGLVAMMDLVNYVGTLDLSKIKVPLLTIYSNKDDIIDVEKIRENHDEFGSSFKKIIDLPEAKGHEIAGQILNPEGIVPTRVEVEKFLQELP